jgi:hypothetical protein
MPKAKKGARKKRRRKKKDVLEGLPFELECGGD